MATSASTYANTIGAMTGATQSHRGHGFALGSVNFALPTHSVPGQADVAMGGQRVRHGSGAGGRGDRERDRDRSSPLLRRIRPASDLAQSGERSSSVPVTARAQATAFRNIPSGPQEEQDFTAALDAVVQWTTVLYGLAFSTTWSESILVEVILGNLESRICLLFGLLNIFTSPSLHLNIELHMFMGFGGFLNPLCILLTI